MTNKTGRCRGCGAEIIFIKTENGKTMPVDMEELTIIPEAGSPQLFVTGEGKVIHGWIAGDACGEPDTVQGYISHFVTCPNADCFRKKRKKDRNA